MSIDEKYLPNITDRVLFIQNRINENKKQVLGGQIEMLLVANNQPAIDNLEYSMKQLIKNIDIYELELKKLAK